MSDARTLQSIANDAKDIFKTAIEWGIVPTDRVPNDDDVAFTFETGRTKRGMKVNTAVLFVDLRNSTELNFKQHPDRLGKLYAAFVRSMIQCAEHHSGVIRNIVGDRVMVVFPEKNCCTNAVNAAISMNTVVTKILNPLFKGDNVRAGIGIDYGTMFVEKVGMPRQGKERDAYKNLVWLGRPANVASKLTDIAGKGVASQSNILITNGLFDQYRRESPSSSIISNNHFQVINGVLVDGVADNILGGNTYWTVMNQVSL